MFKDILDSIENELVCYQAMDKNKLMTTKIKDRLNKSLLAYSQELDDSREYLVVRTSKRAESQIIQRGDNVKR